VNYVALARMFRVCEDPVAAASRYFLGRGDFPCTVRVRTPSGSQEMTLFHRHDAITMHEIFCREDYKSTPPPKVVVDIGSNIGISALYFLTRSPETFCELYEPDPLNVQKLEVNLRGFGGRFSLHETAVADRAGTLLFTREPTGRYGRLEPASTGQSGVSTNEPDSGDSAISTAIEVRVEHVNTVLEDAIARHGEIDLLKIDTEGSELATVHSIDPALLARVRRIVIEWFDRHVDLEGFGASSSGDTVTFVNRHWSSGPR
jgi:FkbM family methyltransferase